MDLALDYNSLSERFSKIKGELDKTIISLQKLNSYEDNRNFVPPEYKKQLFMSLERNPPTEEASDKQYNLSNSSQSEASDDDYPSKKVALQSAVVTRVESSKTRKKFIHTYNSDTKVQLRHRRFLGMVQNTLRKFRDEEIKRQPQDMKQKKVLEKVEAAVEKEKNSARKLKEELLFKSRQHRLELECLEKMMKIAESFELWENNQKYLLNYILTETEPPIFFLPTAMTSTTQKQLERSRMEIEEKVRKQKRFVEMVLSRIRQSYGLSASDSTEEILSEADSSQNSLNMEIADKETEGSLCLDASEDELIF